MKKAIIFATVFLSFNVLQASEFNTIIYSSSASGNPHYRASSGKITQTTSNGVQVIDNVTGKILQGVHCGAQFEFIIGDDVTYKIISPNGNPPILIDVKKGR